MDTLFSDGIKNTPPSFVRGILKAASDQEIISFAGGLPNPISFPKEELLLRIEGEEKHYSVQSKVNFSTVEEKKSTTDKPQAKINMSNTNEINPYLLLMAHTIIRHTIEIDKNTSIGVTSHMD